ncbi:MAG: hypothetical protein RL571_1840 [Pseudomonadota bacterium]|jgi:hypothetical protein
MLVKHAALAVKQNANAENKDYNGGTPNPFSNR